MHANTYVNFNGQCAEALRFYEKTMGGKIEMLTTFAQSPMAAQMPEAMKDKVVHARIRLGDTIVMASDAPPERYGKPQGMMLSLTVDSPADAERIFAALSDGGNVTMSLQQTFFAHRFGMVTDRYGIPWMVNCEKAG
ncbi:MAG: VOC family protein [Alphaproteobacteria bacterium]|nr:VOC family protein [Alphaproteobacteria bacterium]MBV9693104.1 VOC family protein [Alphaproteobacteria bacterium]